MSAKPQPFMLSLHPSTSPRFTHDKVHTVCASYTCTLPREILHEGRDGNGRRRCRDMLPVYWVQVVVTCISQQFPISSAAPLRHSRVVRVQGKLLDNLK